ncbi:UNVERIFIED_CONTAM: sodium:calcium antiporter, partial [Prevotella sp. 15_C9]
YFVFNILAFLVITGLVAPMHILGITLTDLSMLVVSMILIWFLSFTKYTIERWEGFVLTAFFKCYMTLLFYNS